MIYLVSHWIFAQGCVCPLKVELKKLTLEKLQYEKVIQYLKEEMQMLAEQLANLQNILCASNTNTMEENAHLARTIGDLQTVNAQLQGEIAKQVQINQANAAHIADMQGILEEKETELEEIRKILAERDANLEASVMQVTEQQKFIEQVKMFAHCWFVFIIDIFVISYKKMIIKSKIVHLWQAIAYRPSYYVLAGRGVTP